MLLLVACTDAKYQPPAPGLQMRAYAGRPAAEVKTAWCRARKVASNCVPVIRLYKGGAWSASLSTLDSAPFRVEGAVVSAGLGVVKLDDMAPSYAATFISDHADAVPGAAAADRGYAWWSDLGGPEQLQAVIARQPADTDGAGMVVALPRTYLEVVAPAIESAMVHLGASRVMVLGTGGGELRERLGASWVSLDVRYARRLGGTAGQLAVRAAGWLLSRTSAASDLTAAWARSEIAQLDDGGPAFYPSRVSGSDREVAVWIHAWLDAPAQAGRPGVRTKTEALRAYRSSGLACEQSRFGAIFTEVLKSRSSP